MASMHVAAKTELCHWIKLPTPHFMWCTPGAGGEVTASIVLETSRATTGEGRTKCLPAPPVQVEEFCALWCMSCNLHKNTTVLLDCPSSPASCITKCYGKSHNMTRRQPTSLLLFPLCRNVDYNNIVIAVLCQFTNIYSHQDLGTTQDSVEGLASLVPDTKLVFRSEISTHKNFMNELISLALLVYGILWLS